MKIKTSSNICLFLAIINIPIYIIGGSNISLATSLIMFSYYMVPEMIGIKD